jgi:hypothetical protein
MMLNNQIRESVKQISEERQKEILEERQYGKFLIRLKLYAYFFMFFSIFLLLNACIGFSSAPFYLPGINCNRVEPTPECQ